MNNTLADLIKQFMPFAQQHIGFEDPPSLFLKNDQENAKNPLGKTAFYDPQEKSVTLFITGRHPKDILRSLGHELVHHKQNCDGEFSPTDDMGPGYAQRDPHLRDMEEKANLHGSMCLRDFEDMLKKENTIYYEHLQKGDKKMSTKDWKNGELTTILSEAFGFKFTLDKLNEGADKNTGMSGVDGDDDDDTYMGHIKEDEELEEDKKGSWKKGGPSKTRPGEKDDTWKKDEKSKTDKGEKDDTWKKGEKSKTDKGTHDDGSRTGDDSDTGRGKDYVKEDSGWDEKEHDEHNAWSDEDHIDAIEKHLRALRHDRDYEEDHEDLREKAGGNRVENAPGGAGTGHDTGRNRASADRTQGLAESIALAIRKHLKR